MSNQAVSGVVDRTWTKTKSTRYGDKDLHYVSVDGVDFSTGFKKVFNEGEFVNCAVKFNYGELQLQEGANPAGLPKATPGGNKGNSKPASVSNVGGYGNKGKFPIDPKDGQISIIRQSSMDRAVTIVRDLVAAGLFTPTSEDDYIKKCLEIALVVTDFASGNDIMQLAAAKAAAKAAING